MKSQRKVRVRFAPSPTGFLHIGSARSALFNWLFARHNDGSYMVRIEDTDVVRSKSEYVDSITYSLTWLGLESDEPLVIQSSRVQEHKRVAQDLLDKKLAYPCFCEPKGVEEKQEDHQEGVSSLYDGACRDK